MMLWSRREHGYFAWYYDFDTHRNTLDASEANGLVKTREVERFRLYSTKQGSRY